MEQRDLNPKIPLLDANWDYLQLWNMAQKLKVNSEELVNYLAEQRKSNSLTNKHLRMSFEGFYVLCVDCMAAIPGDDIDVLGASTEEE